jgi:hypothetical protein
MESIDREILDWIAKQTGDKALAAQIGCATVKRRDYMKTGFFIYLDTDSTLDPVDAELRPVCPHIESPELMDGAGCSLFLKNGYLHYLEIYTRGGFIAAEPSGYSLQHPA